jgi:hypothetical protein
MSKLSFINFVRTDMSNWLIHCTSSFATLKKILNDKSLKGSNENILGGFHCVCFSEAPLSKITSLISFSEAFGNTIGDVIRYAPFGIAIKKEWLFSNGGRPVIYQPENQYQLLSEHHRYLHVNYDPLQDVDTTWEREWRILTKKLELDEANVTIFVSNRKYAKKLIEEFYASISDKKSEGMHVFPWHLISLEEIV